MSLYMVGRGSGPWVRCACVGLVLLVSGCTEPIKWDLGLNRPKSAADQGLVSDIVGVVASTSSSPWINFEREVYPNPDGISVLLYLISGRTGKGAFGDGVIHATMYAVNKTRDGRRQREKVHEWCLEPDQAYPYRIKEEFAVGWAYGLRLCWGDADVLGKDIMLEFEFERPDGTIIKSQPRSLRVPPPVQA